jgi:hypothetical protein
MMTPAFNAGFFMCDTKIDRMHTSFIIQGRIIKVSMILALWIELNYSNFKRRVFFIK